MGTEKGRSGEGGEGKVEKEGKVEGGGEEGRRKEWRSKVMRGEKGAQAFFTKKLLPLTVTGGEGKVGLGGNVVDSCFLPVPSFLQISSGGTL